jgi:hypothetical protein
MMTSHNFNEASGRAEGMPACMLNSEPASHAARDLENGSIESWIAALLKLAEEQERAAGMVQDAGIGMPSRENKCPLPKLAEGPWRSLGGYFDYSLWADRDRFLELDRAIAAGQECREDGLEPGLDMI